MEYISFLAPFIVLSIISYKIGFKRGFNMPYAFADTAHSIDFKSGKNHDETVNKIAAIISSRNRLEAEALIQSKTIYRLEWAIYFLCDGLHNTGRNFLRENDLSPADIKELKQQVSNSDEMLDYCRSLINSAVVKDDEKFVKLMKFIEERLSINTCCKSEKDFRTELYSLFQNIRDEGGYQLTKPAILAESKDYQ